METDTVHALIERKKKRTPNMTIVYNMEVEDLKNFESLAKPHLLFQGK
nr:unnamed protein product [Callosobruchus analis]